MNTSKYIIALDQGTSSCRAILVDEQGKQVGIAQKEFTQIYPQAGWVEHDPIEIWEVQMEVLDQLLKSSQITSHQIVAIGITNQRETTVIWDRKTGTPIYNAIVWQDKRTIEYCKSLKAEGLEEYTKAYMGLPIDPYFSGTKVQWILNQCDCKDVLFGTIDTWLIWKMTNGKSHVTDYTNASRTILFNIKEKKWDDHILDKLGIPQAILPTVQNSASHFGNFDYQGVTIPITGVAGDQQAALFGQSCVDMGMAKNTYGTGCFMLMNIGDDYIQSSHGLLTTLCCDAYGKPTYALEGSIFMAGAAIQWLRDGLNIIESSSESEDLANQVLDDHDVIVVPAFAGLGAPYWSMESKGAIYGLTRDTTKAHLVKATLDAVAYRTKEVLEAMQKDSEVKLNLLRVDGGACQNDYLMQFQSDILDTKVQRPGNIETTALGAAFLAGITIGLWTSESIAKANLATKIFQSVMTQEKRIHLYQRWQRAIISTIQFR